MATDFVSRQVFDLPEPQPLIVTERRSVTGWRPTTVAAVQPETALQLGKARLLRQQQGDQRVLRQLIAGQGERSWRVYPPPHMTADAVQACAVSILGPLASFERTQPKVHSVSSQKLLLLGIPVTSAPITCRSGRRRRGFDVRCNASGVVMLGIGYRRRASMVGITSPVGDAASNALAQANSTAPVHARHAIYPSTPAPRPTG
jgi:hypothetical protein